MSTTKTTSKKKAPAKKSTAKKPSAKEALVKKAPAVEISAIAFETSYLDEKGVEHKLTPEGEEIELAAGTWCALTIAPGVNKRFLYLLQAEENGAFVLYMLTDLKAVGPELMLRLPRTGAFLRTLVTGTLHVLGSNKQLSREQIAKHIGGHEPPPQQAKPPYT